ncbi:hypothetical protein P4493_05105 [Bacillus thuringiensis]|jgi:hypothetical protein|uniref:Uncharacterized protein n=4 Tax=Bacillus thuringiensis TaxID=1428 RepID=A0AB33AR76_BACTU|nr:MULTISPECIES: hypothetical protein [Bacillus]MEC2535596.1 hypothetical protein [Bacillus cereus]MED1153627.1 hypothetical protein [Bacillus paranthracis]AFQ29952.1 hypothetical protein BTF1_29257 [Bacillus thuringiensis HD-789]AJG74026.1 hypothetical protein BF38_5741 [Bacillus thuringiensis]AJH02971.1 hypothetical protein AS86_6159 [Bacillus thuringiensis HD1002]
MNHMDKVCIILGVDLFEKFNIIKERPNIFQKNIRNPYYFTDEGLMNSFGVLDNQFLADLLVGSLKLEKVNR